MSNDQVAWSKEQTLDGHRVTSAMAKVRTLYVTFPDDWANFNGKVNTDEDLADFLLMVLSYTPQKPGRRIRSRRLFPSDSLIVGRASGSRMNWATPGEHSWTL